MERPTSRARAGVDHVVRMRRNKGLAAAFTAGIDAALKNGADFIVNTDADNQYPGHQIVALLQPLLRRRGRHRDRRSQHCRGQPHVVAQAAVAAPRQLGRAPGIEHVGPRHHERVPRLHARGGAAHDDRLGVFLHARIDHPGGQEAHGDRARADSDQLAHAPVAPLRQHVLVHQAIRGDDRPHLRDVRTAQDLLLHRRRHRRDRPAALRAVRLDVLHAIHGWRRAGIFSR